MAPKKPLTKLQRFIVDHQSMKDDPDYALFQAGIDEGRMQMRKETLGILEDKYLGKDAPPPDRGSEKAVAILELARELSEALKI